MNRAKQCFIILQTQSSINFPHVDREPRLCINITAPENYSVSINRMTLGLIKI